MWQANFEQIVQRVPWLADLWAWSAPIRELWHSIESVALFAGMTLVVFLLRRERRKISGLILDLRERVDTMSQLAKAARADFETAMARPAGPLSANSISNWETVQTIWRETRDRIELAIEQITDRRIKPKYGKIARYNYNDIIITMRDDGVLASPKAFTALIAMNGLFQRLKLRPNAVTPQEVEQFTQHLKDINGALPKLPKAKVPPTPPTPMPVAAE